MFVLSQLSNLDHIEYCFLGDKANLCNAHDHVVASTFGREDAEMVRPSEHCDEPFQKRMVEQARNRMEQHNAKIITKNAEQNRRMEEKGIYCCTAVDEISKSQCMCTFSTRRGRNAHINHKFPTSKLESWIHELHLSGTFAFSLATGTRKNRSKYVTTNPTEVRLCTENPSVHEFVDLSWFSDGCYRTKKYKSFSASDTLKVDLEALFLQGFQTEGPKKGNNKYTPDQALAFLKNLKKSDGRRKYSHDSNNRNGPLPTKQYIQGWFSRRKAKMAEEEKKRAEAMKQLQDQNATNAMDKSCCNLSRYDDDDIDTPECNPSTYANLNPIEVKEIVNKRLGASRFRRKKFYLKLLQNDDYFQKRCNESYQGKNADALMNMCNERMLPSDTTNSSLVKFLELDDEVRKVKEALPHICMTILQHNVVEERMRANNS